MLATGLLGFWGTSVAGVRYLLNYPAASSSRRFRYGASRPESVHHPWLLRSGSFVLAATSDLVQTLSRVDELPHYDDGRPDGAEAPELIEAPLGVAGLRRAFNENRVRYRTAAREPGLQTTRCAAVRCREDVESSRRLVDVVRPGEGMVQRVVGRVPARAARRPQGAAAVRPLRRSGPGLLLLYTRNGLSRALHE
jgi:hypothetical protein